MIVPTRRPRRARPGARRRSMYTIASRGGAAAVPATLLRQAGRIVLRVLNRIVPKRPDDCVVAAFPDVEDGVLALSAALLDDGRRVTALTGGPIPAGFFDPRVRLRPRGSLRGVLAFLRSAHVFVTHGIYGDVVHPSRQVLVYLWHGESPGKWLDAYLGARAKEPGYAPVLSSLGQAFRCAEFGLLPPLVPVLGAPRNDRMLGTTRAAARAALGVADDRTRLLWMPTYREVRRGPIGRQDSTAGYAGLPFDADELRVLDDWLGRHGRTVHVKLHPVQAGAFRLGTRHLVPLCADDLTAAGLTTYTALPAFDGLITDVSSVWVDYLLLDRPIVVAFPDVEEYRVRRGFELEPFEDWVPGRFVRSIPGLTTALAELDADADRYAGRRAASRRLLHRHPDDGSARRIVDFFFREPVPDRP